MVDSFRASQELAGGAVDVVVRRARAEDARDFLADTADELLCKLRRAKKAAARRKLYTLKPCPMWLFEALHSTLIDDCEGELSEHITAIKQSVGARGESERVAHEFHVRSPPLLAQLLSRSGEPEEKTRVGSIVAQPGAKAVTLPTPLTFARRGIGALQEMREKLK